MTPEQRQRIERALWPEAERSRLGVWAVLDCARGSRVYLALLESNLEFRCLYSGRLPRSLEMVAPQLVELFPGHRLTSRLLDEGWGQAWGIFLRVSDPPNLRHHLRKFLKVSDEDGRRLLFRYYDPRVIRAYLPTCRAEELRRVIGGPLAGIAVESADANSLLDFGVESAGLKVQEVQLPRPALAG